MRAQSYSRRPLAPWPALQATHCSPGTAAANWAAVADPGMAVPSRSVPLTASNRTCSGPPARPAGPGRRHRPHRRSPSWPAPQQPGRAPAGPGPAAAWSETTPRPGPGSATAGKVLGPAAGQVQLPVDERSCPGAGVGEEDAQLAVVDLAGGARVLALHPHRGGPLLEEPRLVDHQTPPPGRPGAPGRRRTGRRGPGPDPSRRWPTTAASHRECAPRRARPAASRSCARPGRAAHAGSSAPPAWLSAAEPVCDASVQGVQPLRPGPHFLDVCRLVGLRHRPPAPYNARDYRPITGRWAGTRPHLKPSAAGLLGRPPL
jgi:hypothetical protein